jgi:hypothetical protein
MPLSIIPLSLLASLYSAPEPLPPFRLAFDGLVETAVISNGFRQAGGGELSIGDFLINLRLDAAQAYSEGSVGAYADWVPEQSVLHFRNNSNSNSFDWLHADGYVSRPFILPGVQVTYRDFTLLGGGFLAAGLEPIAGIPTSYYLAMPPPLLHSQHYDKGFRLGYRSTWLHLDASIINGDWCVGEQDLFALSNSAHNSYPSYGANARIDLAGLYLGGTGTYGDIGSYPGEKRRQNNLLGYLGGKYRLGGGEFEARGYYAYYERNPNGDGSGSHVKSVDSTGFGAEVAYRLPHIDFYGEWWELKRSNDGPDGEIWVGEERLGWGYGGGIRWKDPLSLTAGQGLYLGLFAGELTFDEAEWLLVFDLGLRF